MDGSARASTKISSERTAPSTARPAVRARRAATAPASIDIAKLQRAVGNLGIQHLLSLGVLRGQAGVRAGAFAAREYGAPGSRGARSASSSSVSSTAPSPTPATSVSQTKPETAVPPAPVQRVDGETGPASSDTADVAAAIARPAATPGPDNDAGYQAVVKKLGTNAFRLKTPVKKADAKVTEITAAAELPPGRQKEKKAYDQQMNDMAQAPVPKIEDFTVEKFMEDFRHGFEELAKKLPKESEDNHAVSNAVAFGPEKAIAVKKMESARDTGSAALQTAASRRPVDMMAASPTPPAPPELTGDPAGPVPKISNAAAAAPKPLLSKDISLDDQSKALDDALANQVAGGQVLNISEASLAFPVSGEKSFDEAGEAKRKAQEAIRKLIPGYRGVEAGILKKAGSTATHLVDTGVQEYHGTRQRSFGEVLSVQKRHEESVERQKDAVLGQFGGIYNEKKGLVDKELASLNEVGGEFEEVLTKAESDLKSWVRNNLEYIYTPGLLDYSDWIDERRDEVLKEYEKLAGGRKKALDGGFNNMTLYLKALKTVQDRDAKKLFEDAKRLFQVDVTVGARTIAERVVGTLNRANNHIREGQAKTQEIYNGLSEKEKGEYANAYGAVMGQYTTLAESVADKHREIVGDMARSYHKVAGTLQATFEAIRKDVLTSWWQKAWNKIKAVVNAIVEFAARIAELLGEMLRLLGDIISSPRYFFNNLVTGIGRGLSTFVERIDEFLADAFFDWLRGSTGVSVQLPKNWDPPGIFGLFTQLLGLSVETIWQRMEVVYDKTVANAFRRGEVLLDKGLELFAIVKTEGLGGLWTHIKESLGTILKDTLESMKETILYAAVKKVMLEVGKLLVPGGGFIAIAEKIIRLLQFIVEARNKILDLIESFVKSMELAVKGDVSGIVSKVTGALKSFIVVALDFLVTFFGLGGLKSKIERVIDRMRSPIIRGIDWVLGTLKPIVMGAKGAFEKGKEAVVGAGRKVVTAVAGWLGVRKTFTVRKGEQHTLYFDSSARLMMASNNPVVFAQFVNSVRIPPDKSRQLGPLVLRLLSMLRDIDVILANTAIPESDRQGAIQRRLEIVGPEVAELMRETSGALMSSEPPQYGALHNQFGSAMRVRIVDGDPATTGSAATARNSNWESLRKRRETAEPGASTFYVRAHLLNDDLGGPGNDWHNLSVLSQQANNKDWYHSGSHETAVEVRLKGELSQPGRGFIYVVTANYGRGRDSAFIGLVNQLIAHKSNSGVPAPSLPTDLSYLNAYSVAKLQDLRDVLNAEMFVPTGFVCTVMEIDPSGSDESAEFVVKGSDHNITRTIENDIGGRYYI